MTTDATQVTGSLLSGGARAGDVLAERYELLEAVDAEGPSLGYRALDHETERQVLVRTLSGAPLDERTLGEVVERLRGLIGVGGRYLSSLLDVDRENRRPFIVEAWPTGTQLSAIIAARRARGGALSAEEVLPVLGRIVAALAALPDPWHHGDIRTERVWLDTDGLRLTGAYLLAALPSRLVAERVEALGPGALAYAPEIVRGRSGPAADRWAVAAVAWEALTSRAPDVRTDPPELSPDVRIALRRLLDPEPGRRAVDLSALLSALAAQASLAVPLLDPEPHRPPTADIGAPPDRMGPPRARPIAGAADEGTQEISLDQIVEERAARAGRRPIAGAAQDGTQEIALDEIVEEASADDTAKHSAVSGEQDLDPRLVRAALGITLETDPSGGGPDSLDPRLVRAALGVTSDEASAVEELPSDELEVVEERAPARAPRAEPAPHAASPRPSAARPGGAAAAVAAPKAAAPKAAAPRPSAAAPSSVAPAVRAPAPAPAPRPTPATPAAASPAPRPTPAPATSSPSPRPTPAAASPAARPSPAPASPAPTSPTPAPAAPASSPLALPSPAPAATGAGGGTAVVARPEEPRPAPRRSIAGPFIVIAAVVLAVAIVGAGFLVRSWITRERDSAERARHIQERLRQIRDEEGVPAP